MMNKYRQGVYLDRSEILKRTDQGQAFVGPYIREVHDGCAHLLVLAIMRKAASSRADPAVCVEHAFTQLHAALPLVCQSLE